MTQQKNEREQNPGAKKGTSGPQATANKPAKDGERVGGDAGRTKATRPEDTERSGRTGKPDGRDM